MFFEAVAVEGSGIRLEPRVEILHGHAEPPAGIVQGVHHAHFLHPLHAGFPGDAGPVKRERPDGPLDAAGVGRDVRMVKEQPEFIGVVLPVDAGLPVRISFFGLDASALPGLRVLH